MEDVVKRSDVTELSQDLADRMLAGFEQSQATTMIGGGGKDLIKLGKGTGEWTIGQADDPMQIGSRWVINIASICHGWVCWSNLPNSKKNERLGEIMVPMSAPKPTRPDPIEGFAFGEQRSFEAVCLNGEDAGRSVMFKNGSRGTLDGMNKLIDAIKFQLKADRRHPCPIIQFKNDRYKHAQYNYIQVPIFDVVGWADMTGTPKETVQEPAPEPTESLPRAARAAKPPLVDDAPPTQPVQQELPLPRTGQRRRPPIT